MTTRSGGLLHHYAALNPVGLLRVGWGVRPSHDAIWVA